MFNESLQETFELFGVEHIIAVLIVLSVCISLYIFRKKLMDGIAYNIARYLLAFSIITQEVILNIYRIIRGEWQVATSLPLQLCGIAVITTAIILITENKKLFLHTIFVMLIGATMALITPGIENNYGYPHYRFFQFFVSHGLIVTNFTFILFVMDYHKYIEYKYVLRNVITLLSLAAFNLFINLLVNGNYMYIMAKPGEGTAFDLFGEHPWYIINILLFGVPILLHVFYLPFYVAKLQANFRLEK